MSQEEILRLRDTAEQTRVQFKERVTHDNKYDVSCEMVAQSNYHGGKIVVGIDDKTGRVNPLSYQEVQETTNLLGNLASEGVVPQVLLDIETVAVNGGSVVVATVKEGLNKPYHDNKGIVWVKQCADKRKVFDNAELADMTRQCCMANILLSRETETSLVLCSRRVSSTRGDVASRKSVKGLRRLVCPCQRSKISAAVYK